MGYHLATSIAEADANNCSSSNSQASWWKFFWSLQLPQKDKIFVWRVIHNALPVATDLVRRKIITNSTCSVCKSAWESIGHALFGYKYAKVVWQNMNLNLDWKRNRIVPGFTTKPAQTLASFAVNYLTNFKAAKNKYHEATSNNAHTPKPADANPTWKPPTGRDLKLNVDATLDANHNIIGIGVVVRDSTSQVLATLAKPIIVNFAYHEMEAKVMFYSLNWVLQLQLSIAIVETDALLVANALRMGSYANTSYNDLIIDVSSLIFFPQVNVVYAKRSANKVAHNLIKFALEVDETCSWLEDLSPPFYSVIVNDIHS
ncbi:hypothetical protein CsatB_019776 [Cannabis sativa]